MVGAVCSLNGKKNYSLFLEYISILEGSCNEKPDGLVLAGHLQFIRSDAKEYGHDCTLV